MMASLETSKLTPLQKAVAALERMQARLSRLEDAQHAPIAVVGIGCRLPGKVERPEDFWKLLAQGADLVTEIPKSRFDAGPLYDPDPDAPGKMYAKAGAFLDSIDTFDAAFFGISGREAAELDPRQRLLLETSWEALERAGIVPRTLEGSRTGVFVGIEESDYGGIGGASLDRLSPYTGLGRMTSTAAGRLSYVLGLQGPCLALNTACSSSLVAIHLACQSLRAAECDLALAGGVSLLLSPLGFVALSRTRALAPDGRCKTFSARADGYGRGEGCGMIALKRLSDALADGDHVAAVIRGSAVAHDGTSSGLTVPNGSSQRQVLAAALENARLEARDVGYVECHGTGTALGDPIEVGALAAVYGADRPKSEPLLVGTAKTNVGHLEAAAGMAGLLKVVLSFAHAQIAPSLHFDRPNPHIPWSEIPVEVVTELRRWPGAGGTLRAGLSAFGISGTNAHLILESGPAPKAAEPAPAPEISGERHLLLLSAKTETALAAQAGRLAREFPTDGDLGDAARTLAKARSAFRHRLAFSATDRASAIDVLARAEADLASSPAATGVASATPPPVAFMITGQGAQYAGMTAGLYAHWPDFRAELDRSASLLAPELERPLLSVLFDRAAAASIDETSYTQPAMFAVCRALALLWRSFGVEPAFLIGHSVGEYVAACLAGVFSVEDAVRLIAARARLMQALPVKGAMVSIEAGEAAVAREVAPLSDSVSIAAINGPLQTVIAGDEIAVQQIARSFAARGAKTKRLSVSHAFHSPLMRPMIDAYRRVAESVAYAKPRIPLVSNVTGRIESALVAGPDYWVDHVLAPVRMHDGLSTILASGTKHFLEIGPTPVLCGLGAAAWPKGEATFVPSLVRDRDDRESMLAAAARLWIAGVAIDPVAVDRRRPRRKVSLPTYAFQRERHWIDAPPPSTGGEIVDQIAVGTSHQPYLEDHVVHGRLVVPGAFYVALVLAVATEKLGATQVNLRDVEFVRPLFVEGAVRLTVRLTPDGSGGHRFTVASSDTHAQGRVEIGAAPSPSGLDLSRARGEHTEPVSIEAAYVALGSMSIAWGPKWRWMAEGYRTRDSAMVRLEPPFAGEAQAMPLHPCAIDNGFAAGMLASLEGASAPGKAEPWLPYSVSSFRLHRPPAGPIWCRSTRRTGEGSTETAVFDLVFWEASGALVAEADGFAVKRAPKRAFLHRDLPFYALVPRPTPAPPRLKAGLGRIAIAGDRTPLSFALSEALEKDGAHVARLDLVQGLDGIIDALICVWGPAESSSRSVDVAAKERAAEGLSILQAVLRAQKKPALIAWVTENAVDLGDGTAIDPSSATLWGLARAARAEHPEIGLRSIDLRGRAGLLAGEIFAGDEEPEVVVTDTARFALRLEHLGKDDRTLTLPDAPDVSLSCDGHGLAGLSLGAALRRAPQRGEVEVEVDASGLNFRDVVNVLGMVQGLGPLGGEIAGVVRAAGEDVEHLSPGDVVIGLAAGGLSSSVTADARWLVRRPLALSVLEGATMPVAFLTALIALRKVAEVRPGERVLIHSAAGGVGMAAIQLAHLLDAEVYATASLPKWTAVRALGVEHVHSSRSLDFAAEIRAAGGVDVVINTLAGEFVDASLALLRPGGRFVELGKTDLRDPALVASNFPGIRYAAFDLARIAVEHPEAIQTMLLELADHFQKGALSPLPVRAWPIAEAPRAFDWMVRAQHVGKIALWAPGRAAPRFRRDGAALITGGLGALGLEVARWLVASQGVRHLILAGRRPPSPQAAAAIAELRSSGATVEVHALNVADPDDARRLFASLRSDRPLRVVVHAAGVLDDGVITDQSADRFAAVLDPKVSGAWNLHRLTEHLDLDAFVLFSSISGWLGTAGQSSYAAANAFLDALAAHRRARGLTATSIAWGAWTGDRESGGMAARLSAADRARMRESGLLEIQPGLGLALLEGALGRERASIGAFLLDVERLASVLGGRVPPMLRAIAGGPGPSSEERAKLALEISALSPSARTDKLESLIAEEVSRVMRVGSVPRDQPLQEHGLDSLMAVELRNGIARRIGKPLKVTLLFDHPTVEALSRHVLAELLDVEVRPAPFAEAAAPAWSEPIAVVGVGCRFPGGVVDADSFWKLLAGGVDAIGEVPPERWDVDAYFDPDPDAPGKMYTRWGGFLPDIDRFDPGFFGISGREAKSVDPQERLMLEVSWEALEHAGITEDTLVGSRTGVYMGVCGHEYSVLAMSDAAAIDAYSGLGTAHSAMVGRISYCLGLVGPNLAIDTACSSSLVAVHLACQALRAGECTRALAGGANTILFPEGTVYFSRLRAMSPTGRCRAFSAAADGYVRSEGAGVVVLERLTDALASGHRILAVIRGTAVNQDGRSQGLTAPNGPAQEAVIRQALAGAGVPPDEVDYVECHGTGTPLGDPIELGALAAVYGKSRTKARPLAIGSVKSNLGHTEGAAGVAGLIKAVLSLERAELPKSLHAEELNPHVDWEHLPIDVVRRPRPWPRDDRPRRAGVSAFAFSGTNVHVILEEADRTAPAKIAPSTGSVVLAISAKSRAALRGQAQKLAEHLAKTPDVDLADLAHALRAQRSAFWHRLAIETGHVNEARERLLAFAAEGRAHGAWAKEAPDRPPPIAFLFTGQGAQYWGMARGLYRSEPIFRSALDRVAALFDRQLERPLLSVLYAGGKADGAIDETAYAQPAIFALGHALAELWKHWGVVPSLVLGHSVGEIVAAHTAGVFSLEDAVRLVAARGRLMQALTARGAMVTIGAGEARVLEAIDGRAEEVSIAAVNGPAQVVISGEERSVLAIAERFEAEGARTRRLRVSHAFHSPLMRPMLDEFRQIARTVAYSPPSTRIGGAADDIASAEYWVEHILRPVRFFEALRALIEGRVAHFLELGPAPVLCGIGATSFPDAPVEWLASLREDRDERNTILECAARLWTSGTRIAWHDVQTEQRSPIALPTYAFERERHWLDTRPTFAPKPAEESPIPETKTQSSSAIDLTALSGEALGAWVHREVAAALGAGDPAAISPSRKLFDQGLDSLIAVELRHRLSAGLGRPLPVTVVFEKPTINQLASYLKDELERGGRGKEQQGADLIVPLGASPLLFLLPGAFGVSMDFFYLSQRLAPEWTVCALDYPGVNGGEYHTDIRTLKHALAEEILRFAKSAPIALGGHSFGGGVAWEVCHAILERGHRVELLMMFDTFSPLGLDGYAVLEQAHYTERLDRIPSARALLKANSEMVKNWKTCSRLPEDMRIVLFKVKEKDSDAMKTAIVEDPRDLWAESAAPGTLVVEHVPGIHGDFVAKTPDVDVLARHIHDRLAEARGRVRARVVLSHYGARTE